MNLDRLLKLASDETTRRLLVSVTERAGAGGLDLNALLDHLQQGGLQGQVQSWVALGPNRPVTAEQIRDALGADTVDAAAGEAGTSPERAAATLADVLPAFVDGASPSGVLPDATSLQDAMSQILRPR